MFAHDTDSSATHRTAVVYPLQPSSIHQVVPLARFAERRAARRLWIGQSLTVESHQVFAALAGMGLRLPCATGVALAPLRHPYHAAVEARSVATLTGEPFVAGIGLGAPEFQRMVMREPYPSPRTAALEFATTMRALLSGQPVEHQGRYHDVHAKLQPFHAPPVEIGLGVLRPRMARTAGGVADVAITWMTPPDYVRDTLAPELAAGAAEAGTATPRIATVVHVALTRPGRDIEHVAFRGAGTHLGAAHYTDMLRKAGLAVDAADPKAGARALLQSGVFVTGTAQEIAEALQHYRHCGVDEVVLNPAGVMLTEGVHSAIADLEEIFDAEGAVTHG
ncbi:LLM class flavin-dependent oxidoreductase [Streptomyces kaniharaensis]|uniref:LLM class flavin-dependent oxidoreductase n=1 Tax=Streptomyces kaniharaensis TaxID=212423 RepID=A0A6N7KSL8_9ACTN|nr:LLM class flavin-dependent oxidoreductase [Streptomyces kaniharaensis]MQS12994.1 LLM class flavin-dependent oxidoreductase [Streptomyces kaniharaensis]